MSNTIIRLPGVMAQTGLTRSTLYGKMAAGKFPAQINLGGRSVGWLSEEVSAWIEARIKESRQGEKVQS